MTGLPIHHVALAVDSLEAAIPLFESIVGARSSPPELLADQGVRVAFVGPGLELVEPLAADSGVGRFLARRGPGLHHVALASCDLEADLRRLATDGFEIIEPAPRRGAFGHRVAFMHPRTTGKVLLELVEVSDVTDP